MFRVNGLVLFRGLRNVCSFGESVGHLLGLRVVPSVFIRVFFIYL